MHATKNIKKGVGIFHFLNSMKAANIIVYYGTPYVTSSLDRRGRSGWLNAYRELKKAEILHFHSTPSYTLCLMAKLVGVKIVRTVHFIGGTNKVSWQRPVKKSLVANLFVDHWVAVSKECQSYIQARWGVESELIYNGIDTDFFRPPTDRSEIRSRLGLGTERVFVAVGQLTERKRVKELVDAFRGVDGTLLLIGDGHLRDDLTAPGVRLMGYLDSDAVRDVLWAADVFVHAARYEAFGLAVAEAQATGLPAIVIEGSGAAEIVEPGVTGLVVPPEELGQAMATIGQFADTRQRVVELFSSHGMRARYQELYANLISAAVSGPKRPL